MENENEDVILSDDEYQAEDTELDESSQEEQYDETEELRKQIETLKAQKDHWRKKAQNTTADTKPEVHSSKTEKSDDIDVRDLFALSKAGIEEDEDIDEVLTFAKLKGVSVREALQSKLVKALIADKEEFRKTAQVTNTSNARRSVSKISDDVLLTNLNKGEVPAKGSEEAERIFWARRGGKR